MVIKEIIIKNFRQYYDVTLSFTAPSLHDLNYVLAENGIGKTTLLNAITWCLYGKELHITQALKEKTLPLLTLKKLREMNVSEEADTEVGITLSDSEGDIIFKRKHVFRKTEEGLAYEKTKEQRVILMPNNSEPEVFTDEETFNVEVNKRLPYKIQSFFFFDGEQLDTYLANATGENVEQTVLQISQIDLLVTMEKNLETITTEMRRKASKANSKADEYNNKFEAKDKEANDLSEKISIKKEELSQAKNKLMLINDELGDDPDISVLENERDDLDKQLKEIKKEQTENNKQFKQFLKKYLILLNALPRLKSMYDSISEKEKNKQLPPKYDKNELQEMLTECTCHVCNRKLDTDATIFIAELVKRYELGQETGAILSQIYGTIEMLIKQAKNYENERDALLKTRERLGKDENDKASRLKSIDSLIDKYTDKEKIIKLYAERSELEEFIETTLKQIGRFQAEYDNTITERDVLKKQLDDALKADEKNAKLRREKDLAERATVKVGEIIKEIKGGIRKQISDEMSSKFFELMWKTKFSKVEITENYSASVINNDGFECLGSCSAAERELLVLAFTLALHKQSGFEGPLVIDTPISRISGDLRESFAKVLRTVSENKQILLFVTEDEYSTNVKDVFEPYANQKYKFELVDEDYVKVGAL